MTLRDVEKILDKKISEAIKTVNVYHFKEFTDYNRITVVISTGLKTNEYRDIQELITDVITKNQKANSELIVQTLRLHYGAVGVAFCHNNDQFNRTLGRVMSKGRLLKLLSISRT